ncbi:MAG: ABC transporter ATP-binding protein [Pyrinomonadaceae bacterium]|nr:ABC transporter ATP-binding protein [Pyrinomonadaceae bacterium]
MSKVQSPKSQAEDSETTEARGSARSVTQGTEADSGLWTLDFGLKVTDLRKSFLTATGERIAVLRGVTFSVNPGESVAIMGASGAGKSTLLHLLGGLEAPDHGSIAAGDLAVEAASQSALARFRNHQVGFVFQFHHLLTDLTAAENVSLPLLVKRTNPREAARRAIQTLEEIGLGDRASHLVGNLSGGEQQRVALCRALINQPAIVLADEPTGNLDDTIGDEIARSLVKYAQKVQAVVILATHSHAVASLCNRVLTLRDGRLLSAS